MPLAAGSVCFHWRIALLAAALFVVERVSPMRLVVQRVKSASVSVAGVATTSTNGVPDGERSHVVSQIGPGIMALVGIHENDTVEDLQYCCKRLLGCKLWANDNGGQWRHSVKQKNYECLLVSQFTLYGTLSKKQIQPDYKLAMKAVPAEQLYREFLAMVRAEYQADKIHDGVFGAMMDVALVNDGPVTIIIESEPKTSVEGADETCVQDAVNDDKAKRASTE